LKEGCDKPVPYGKSYRGRGKKPPLICWPLGGEMREVPKRGEFFGEKDKLDREIDLPGKA